MAPAIRLATPDDTDIIAAHNIAMAKETENMELDKEVITAGVRAILQDTTKGLYFVTEDDNNSIIAQLMITYEWSDWRNRQIWWIQSVYVVPEHRRQGHYKRLYQHVKEQAHVSGACGVRLYAYDDNEKAQKVYEALGMISHYKVYEDMFVDYR
eukprot:TRINITY_DN19926_c0_g1_i1.p2 TRINITY_DN19926_c0_g1~~TRINITY_DN19926_c0_g1_i1.p2  ORF type:complete len:154 (-),score=14.29 TRINITY_DN19926_c0_g1_i1:202-663(-)